MVPSLFLILIGFTDSQLGVAPPSEWNLPKDRLTLEKSAPLQVARCTKIIERPQKNHYLITINQIAKFVVDLHEQLSPVDIEEGMRVGVQRGGKYQISLPLPPPIDKSIALMTVEEKPDVTYADVGGCKEQIEQLIEVVELPLLNVILVFLIFLD